MDRSLAGLWAKVFSSRTRRLQPSAVKRPPGRVTGEHPVLARGCASGPSTCLQAHIRRESSDYDQNPGAHHSVAAARAILLPQCLTRPPSPSSLKRSTA